MGRGVVCFGGRWRGGGSRSRLCGSSGTNG